MLTLAWLLAGAASLPMLVVAAECAAGLGASKARVPTEAPPFAVLVPAHDEAAGIAVTIAAVRAQLRPCDRLLVVADNCTDGTAAVAIRAGAAVSRRHDPARRGKAHALAHGRDALRAEPPAVVVLLDADCIPGPGALARLAAAADRHGAAVQGRYLLVPDADADPLVRISSFAFLVKNDIRQRGLQRLGQVALLQGSGMAMPWAMFAAAPLAGASLVEDLKLGLDLALGGHAIRFEPAATIVSRAGALAATRMQRTRWEHGTLATAATYLPRIAAAMIVRQRALAVLGADLLVPPLALLVTLVALVAATLGVLALAGGSAAPLVLLAVAATLFAATLVRVWQREGQALLPRTALRALPRYLFWKQPVYRRLVTGRERDWVRTGRQP